jgi:alkanesulfonate monooxygenase
VTEQGFGQGLQVFSTCPQSRNGEPGYLRRAVETARWSETAGCDGILVYADNGLVDPWLVAQAITQGTEHIGPLVAVQPVYMHPYAAAKMVASIAHMYGRRLFINMLAGGFRNDLVALGDDTPHDDRYARTLEYTLVMQRLLENSEPVTFEGNHYSVHNLRLTPPVADELRPGFLISGSSAAGRATAAVIRATAVEYPEPVDDSSLDDVSFPDGVRRGARVGIIARPTDDEGWRVALGRFPEDRRGRATHRLAVATSDSEWHHRLSTLDGLAERKSSPYWLGPFHNYQTFCPYLVGSYETVAGELARYIGRGFRTFILDIPSSQDDLETAATAFRLAAAQGGIGQPSGCASANRGDISHRPDQPDHLSAGRG